GCTMPESVSLLMLQFLDWVSHRPRTYAETMDAWRSSCPRLTVWEDALIDGLIQLESGAPGQHATVTLTPRGRVIVDANHPQPSAPTVPVTSDPRGQASNSATRTLGPVSRAMPE